LFIINKEEVMTAMKKFYFSAILLILTLSASFIGYGVYINKSSDSYIDTMMQSRAVSLTGLEIAYRDLYPEIYLDYIGLRGRNQADVIAQIDGMIEEMYVAQGDEVALGQKLCKIVNNDIPLAISRANTDIAKAEAAYFQAKSNMERNMRLASEDAVSRSELELSVSQAAASKAEYEAAKIAGKQISQQMSSQIVTAPLAGSVILNYQQAGNFVGKGSPIAMIADFDEMYFTIMIQDKKIRNISPIEGGLTLHTDLSNMTEKAFDSPAKAAFSEDTFFNIRISDVSPPQNQEAPVRSMTCAVENPLGVMELGMYTDIVIRKKVPKRVLAVPIGTLTDLEAPRIYVRDDESRLALRDVKTGVYNGEYIEIAEGLEEGDVIITSGVDGLELGIKIDVRIEEWA
jgi:RND family efflux transporter MFP subunit